MQSIIFVHTGNAFYLPLVLKQARKTNPTIDIILILIGDESNKGMEGVKHFLLKDYFDRATSLDRIFINHSPNARSYELFCFQRWLII